MRQTIVEDLQRLKITDPKIVDTATAGDLDGVVKLLEPFKADEEVAFMIITIEGWRAYLNTVNPKPSDEAS